jgi:hypothetical protein
LRDLRHLRHIEGALGFELEPLLLEGIQRFLHAELDEEVTEELIGLLLALTGN